MTETEKFAELKKYLFRRYKEESNIYAESDENGELVNAAKASICLETLWEIIVFANKLNKTEEFDNEKPTDNANINQGEKENKRSRRITARAGNHCESGKGKQMKEPTIEGQLIYVAHPYGGKEENVRRAAECLRKLKKMYPYQTLFSPLNNWDWDSYDADHQAKPMQDCLTVLKKCDAIVLYGMWRKSMGCMQEYAAACVLGIPTFELDTFGVREIL